MGNQAASSRAAEVHLSPNDTWLRGWASQEAPLLPLPPACRGREVRSCSTDSALPASRLGKGHVASAGGEVSSPDCPSEPPGSLLICHQGSTPQPGTEPWRGWARFQSSQVISGPGNDEKDGGKGRDGLRGEGGAEGAHSPAPQEDFPDPGGERDPSTRAHPNPLGPVKGPLSQVPSITHVFASSYLGHSKPLPRAFHSNPLPLKKTIPWNYSRVSFTAPSSTTHSGILV